MQTSDFEQELKAEQIRHRMIKNAARIWGVDEDDVESSFDPIVIMLIEACAYELNKINREMMSSRTRILNRLAQTLSPQTLTGARPAHTMMQARSSDITTIIDTDAQFSTSIKMYAADVDKKEVIKEIYYSPNCAVKLMDVAIRFMAAGTKLFEYKNGNTKNLIAEESSASRSLMHDAWIALEVNPKIQNVEDLLIYIDWKNDPDEKKYISNLHLTKWNVGPYKLEAVQGMQQQLPERYKNYNNIDDQYNITSRTENFVARYYNDSLFTLKSGDTSKINVQDFLTNYPSEFAHVFSQQTLSRIENKFLWVRLRFNSSIPVSALQEMYIAANCFPAINRKANKITYQLKNNLSIVPLATEDNFLDMIQLSSADGSVYKSNPLNSGYQNEIGYYTIRQGGIERFDQRHASELLTNILDRLRDESAAFNSLGNDFINNQINQINQSIALIESRIDTKGTKLRPSHFLMVKGKTKDETVFAKFWTTTGRIAEVVKPGTKLTLQSSGDLKSDSVCTVNVTSGGAAPLSESEKVVAYKKALLTHDRILTEHDIISFTKYELGDLIQDVEVKKGWSAPADHNIGFQRIILVELIPRYAENFDTAEWNERAKALLVKLEMHSNQLLPINVIYRKPNLQPVIS